MVLARVSAILIEKIPEIIGVEVESDEMLLEVNNVDSPKESNCTLILC